MKLFLFITWLNGSVLDTGTLCEECKTAREEDAWGQRAQSETTYEPITGAGTCAYCGHAYDANGQRSAHNSL